MRKRSQGHPPRQESDLRDKVVVVTGASSGLGREAAIGFAARGATVVLAARRAEALEETALQCREAGGRAVCQVTDVTVEDQVNRLAAAALGVSGRIDVWVNNAGMTSFSRLEEGAFDEHRRVLETNLYGAMYGARVVVPIFRRQGQGVLINVGALSSEIGHPFVPAYVISKFALRGMSEALRAELADQPNIHVCSIYPYAMDTAHFENAVKRARSAYPLSPLQSPQKVARAIVELALHPQRDRYVPRSAVLGMAVHALFPRSTERVLFDALNRWHFGIEPEASRIGNLFWPRSVRGEAQGNRLPSLSTWRLLSWALARFCSMPFESLQYRSRRHQRKRASRDTNGRARSNELRAPYEASSESGLQA